ncbi:MAG: hypothetical protein ACUVQF_03990 [Fervidobacterium sp.]|uniref:hypothetical protein n=1 Tax=Fervidobacterium sp. TaxID=1871331 RepID=UPI00404986FA
MPTLDAIKVEELISKVPGVKAVKVVGDNSTLHEIHVITTSDKSPKQLVRDIETVVLASTGIRLDRKIISIAQVEADVKTQKILPYQIANLKIENIDERNVRVNVTIEHGEEEFYGEFSGPKTSRNVPRVIGNAVLNALSEIHDFALSFDDIAEVYFVGKKYVLVHITKQYNNIEEGIIGTAVIEGNYERAVAEAVLDAFRRL